MRKSVSHYPGPEVISADVTVTGKIKAAQFRATEDGTTSEFAYTWDADPNIGLRRNGADSFTVGVAGNSPLAITQFTASFFEAASFAGGITTTAFITPAAITGAQNDYLPASWNGSRAGIYQDLTANANLTGLAATSNGHIARIINISTTAARTLTLNHDNAGSSAVNRFYCPNLTDYVLAPGEGVWVHYDTGVNRWRVIGTA